jgi:uncharacterized caspase-like protein
MNQFHFGVVVGIDEYPGIRNLSAARNDARAFHKWLTNADGGSVPATNVELVEATGPFHAVDQAQPSRDLVNRAFKKIHSRVRQHHRAHLEDWEQSRLYVYFSGHGVTPKAQEVAVLMADASEEDLGYNIACGLYLHYYQMSQDFHELVFFADCCRSLKGNAPLSPPPFATVVTHRGHVRSVLGYATQYQDVAYEPTNAGDDGRGFYTKALLEGLEGAATDKSAAAAGEINSTSLQGYVRDRVKELTRNNATPQVPDMNADPAAKVVFRVGAQRPKRSVTLHFPGGFTRPVVLSDGRLQAVGQHNAAQGDWVVELEDGNYEIRPQDRAHAQEFRDNGLFKIMGENRRVEL